VVNLQVDNIILLGVEDQKGMQDLLILAESEVEDNLLQVLIHQVTLVVMEQLTLEVEVEARIIAQVEDLKEVEMGGLV
jgi:hypothetical protein